MNELRACQLSVDRDRKNTFKTSLLQIRKKYFQFKTSLFQIRKKFGPRSKTSGRHGQEVEAEGGKPIGGAGSSEEK